MDIINVISQGSSEKLNAKGLQDKLQEFSFYNEERAKRDKWISNNLKVRKKSCEKNKKGIEQRYKKEIISHILHLSLGKILEQSNHFVNANYRILMSGLKGFFKSLDVSKIDYDKISVYDSVMLRYSINVLPSLFLSDMDRLNRKKLDRRGLYSMLLDDNLNIRGIISDICNIESREDKIKINFRTFKNDYINLCNLAHKGNRDKFEKEAFKLLENLYLKGIFSHKTEKELPIYDMLKIKLSNKIIKKRLNKRLKSNKTYLELVSKTEELDTAINKYNERLSENILDVLDDKYKISYHNLRIKLQRITSLEEGTVTYKGKIEIEEDIKDILRKIGGISFYERRDEQKRRLLNKLKSEKIGQVEDCGKINVETHLNRYEDTLNYEWKIPNIPTPEETSKIISNTKDFFERGSEELMKSHRHYC